MQQRWSLSLRTAAAVGFQTGSLVLNRVETNALKLRPEKLARYFFSGATGSVAGFFKRSFADCSDCSGAFAGAVCSSGSFFTAFLDFDFLPLAAGFGVGVAAGASETTGFSGAMGVT